jgi:hypothetical protein
VAAALLEEHVSTLKLDSQKSPPHLSPALRDKNVSRAGALKAPNWSVSSGSYSRIESSSYSRRSEETRLARRRKY